MLFVHHALAYLNSLSISCSIVFSNLRQGEYFTSTQLFWCHREKKTGHAPSSRAHAPSRTAAVAWTRLLCANDTLDASGRDELRLT